MWLRGCLNVGIMQCCGQAKQAGNMLCCPFKQKTWIWLSKKGEEHDQRQDRAGDFFFLVPSLVGSEINFHRVGGKFPWTMSSNIWIIKTTGDDQGCCSTDLVPHDNQHSALKNGSGAWAKPEDSGTPIPLLWALPLSLFLTSTLAGNKGCYISCAFSWLFAQGYLLQVVESFLIMYDTEIFLNSLKNWIIPCFVFSLFSYSWKWEWVGRIGK